MPFVDGEFMFSESAFRRLFPARIVDHLITHGRPFGSDDLDRHWLPVTDRLPIAVAVRLPIAVAVRLSPSFPALLSAVPLVSLDWTLQDEDER